MHVVAAFFACRKRGTPAACVPNAARALARKMKGLITRLGSEVILENSSAKKGSRRNPKQQGAT